tara:strand:- start:106 stop:1881 length:1776 start_codon:yes stop_codon:yes gene_type:complete
MTNSYKLTDNSEERNFLFWLGKEYIFEIPLYQRIYKWKADKQIESLKQDFDEIIDGQKIMHFFGAIIIEPLPKRMEDPERYEIIDGQQRMTTVFFFVMAAIYQIRRVDEEKAVKLFKKFLIIRDKEIENCKFQPSIEDRAQINWIFANIITKDFKVKLENEQASYREFKVEDNSKTNGRAREAYTSFKRYIELKIKNLDDKDKSNEIEKILEKILSASSVVSLVIKEKQYGPIIFDKLNAGQEKITTSELVKNFIFGRISKEGNSGEVVQQFHDIHWKDFDKQFKDGKSAENYFFPFALIGVPSIRKEEVYRSITNIWQKKEYTSEQIIENLKEYQPAFNALQNGKVFQYNKKIGSVISNLHTIKLSITTYPFVMQVIRKVEVDDNFESTALNILNFLEAFYVRRALCDREPTGLHAVFKNLWITLSEREDFSSKAILEIINQSHSSQKPPNDKELTEGIKTVKLANKKICNFVLEQFDKSFKGEYPECPNRNVEHVLPVRYTHWKNDFTSEEHEELVNTFANLVFLTDKLNKEVSNKPYSEKRKAILGKAMFTSTRKLFEENQIWTPNEINKRAVEISEWACKRWECPKV